MRGNVTKAKPGVTKSATMYDVAKLAGVSHQTVSRLLLGYEGIRPETREKVLGAIRELDYRTNVSARNLRTGRTGMISLAIPSLNQPYFAELAQSVMSAALDKGLTVFVETTDGVRERELEVVSGQRRNLVDGVIWIPDRLANEDIGELGIDFPLVLVGDRVLHSQFDHVTFPNFGGARAAVEHLISLGRRRIAVIGVEEANDFGASTPRLAGYQAALADAGIPLDPDLLVYEGAWVRKSGFDAAERLLASKIDFDAIFCFNDALALGALRVLLAAGIRVPDDVAVVGFDNIQDAFYSTPSLTTISPGRDEIASAAVEMLSNRLNGTAGNGGPADIVPNFELIVRESTVGLGRPFGGLQAAARDVEQAAPRSDEP